YPVEMLLARLPINFLSKLFIILYVAIGICQPAHAQSLQRYQFQQPQMGTLFRIICYAPSQKIAANAADSAFKRISELNKKLSDYKKNSELNRLSRTSGSGQEVAVSDDLFYVLRKAQRIAHQTNGAFDVTVGPYTHLWRKLDKKEHPQLSTTT